MAVVLSDTFTDTSSTALTSHTMDVGGGWTSHLGTWQINGSNQAVNVGSTFAIVSADAGVGDADAQVDLISLDSTGDFADGIMARGDAGCNNGWVVAARRLSSGTPILAIFQRTGGSNTLRASANAVGVNGTSPTLFAKFAGSSIQASLSSPAVNTSYSSSTYASQTRWGLWDGTSLSATTGAWDNFIVDDGISGGNRRRRFLLGAAA